MSLNVATFKIIRDGQSEQKTRFSVSANGDLAAYYTEFNLASVAASRLAGDVRITKQYYFRGEWFTVAHYISDDRSAQLQKLKDQRRELTARFQKQDYDLGSAIEKLSLDLDTQ